MHQLTQLLHYIRSIRLLQASSQGTSPSLQLVLFGGCIIRGKKDTGTREVIRGVISSSSSHQFACQMLSYADWSMLGEQTTYQISNSELLDWPQSAKFRRACCVGHRVGRFPVDTVVGLIGKVYQVASQAMSYCQGICNKVDLQGSGLLIGLCVPTHDVCRIFRHYQSRKFRVCVRIQLLHLCEWIVDCKISV